MSRKQRKPEGKARGKQGLTREGRLTDGADDAFHDIDEDPALIEDLHRRLYPDGAMRKLAEELVATSQASGCYQVHHITMSWSGHGIDRVLGDRVSGNQLESFLAVYGSDQFLSSIRVLPDPPSEVGERRIAGWEPVLRFFVPTYTFEPPLELSELDPEQIVRAMRQRNGGHWHDL